MVSSVRLTIFFLISGLFFILLPQTAKTQYQCFSDTTVRVVHPTIQRGAWATVTVDFPLWNIVVGGNIDTTKIYESLDSIHWTPVSRKDFTLVLYKDFLDYAPINDHIFYSYYDRGKFNLYLRPPTTRWYKVKCFSYWENNEYSAPFKIEVIQPPTPPEINITADRSEVTCGQTVNLHLPGDSSRYKKVRWYAGFRKNEKDDLNYCYQNSSIHYDFWYYYGWGNNGYNYINYPEDTMNWVALDTNSFTYFKDFAIVNKSDLRIGLQNLSVAHGQAFQYQIRAEVETDSGSYLTNTRYINVLPAVPAGTLSTEDDTICLSTAMLKVKYSGGNGRIIGWRSQMINNRYSYYNDNCYGASPNLQDSSYLRNYRFDEVGNYQYAFSCPKFDATCLNTSFRVIQQGDNYFHTLSWDNGKYSNSIDANGNRIFTYYPADDMFGDAFWEKYLLAFGQYPRFTLTAIVETDGCVTAETNPIQFTLMPQMKGGSIASSEFVCPNFTTELPLKLVNQKRKVLRWESSTDRQHWDTIAHTLSSFHPAPLTQSTYFRAVTDANYCVNEIYSDPAYIQVTDHTVPGVIVGDSTTCVGEGNPVLFIEQPKANVIHWEMSESGGNSWVKIPHRSRSYLHETPLVQPTLFRAWMRATGCDGEYTNAFKVIPYPDVTPYGGKAVAFDDALCYNQSAVVELQNYSGRLLRWEYKSDCEHSHVTVGNKVVPNNWKRTDADQEVFTSVALSNYVQFSNDYLCFRAVVVRGTYCDTAYSRPDTVYVKNCNSGPNGGSGSSGSGGKCLANDKPVCVGDSLEISVTENRGQIIRWEYVRGLNSVNWLPIPKITSKIYALAEDTNTCFRCITFFNGQEYASVPFCMKGFKEPNGGTLSESQEVCYKGTTEKLILSKYIGIIDQWEISTDLSTWSPLELENKFTPHENFAKALTQSCWIRVKVILCDVVGYSDTINISVTPDPASIGGEITMEDEYICLGSNAEFILQNYIGRVVRWEVNTYYYDKWDKATIYNISSDHFTILVDQPYMGVRALVRNASCADQYSEVFQIKTVNPDYQYLSLSALPAKVVCFNGSVTLSVGYYVNKAVLNLIGLEQSFDDGNNWQAIALPEDMILKNLTRSFKLRYRFRLANCPQDLFSNVLEIQVLDRLKVGTLKTSKPDNCPTQQVTVSLENSQGALFEFQTSPDGEIWTGTGKYTRTEYNLTAKTETQIRCIVYADGCPPETTNVVILKPISIKTGNIHGAVTVCKSLKTIPAFELKGFEGQEIIWSYFAGDCSSNNSKSWNVIPQNTPVLLGDFLLPLAEQKSLCLRAMVKTGDCISEPAYKQINIIPDVVSGTLKAEESEICANTRLSLPIRLIDYSGKIVRWEQSTDNRMNWTPITHTSAEYLPQPTDKTTYYRVIIEAEGCGQTISSDVVIRISDLPKKGIITPVEQQVCKGKMSLPITLFGYTGFIERWETSTDNGQSWDKHFTGDNKFATPVETQTVQVRAVIKCTNDGMPVYSAVSTITRIDTCKTCENANMNVKVVTVKATCRTCKDGSILVTPKGSFSPFRYSLDGLTFQSPPIFTNLGVGSYQVYVKDRLGCIDITQVDVLSPTDTVAVNPCEHINITAQAQIEHASCKICEDGRVTIEPAGGKSPYLYTKDGITFSPSPVFTGLKIGKHTFTIQDSNGCSVRLTVTIRLQFVLPACDSLYLSGETSVQNASCKTCADGSITVNGIAGRPPYVYSLNGNTYQPENTFPNLISGIYPVFVKDANNCVFITSDSVGFEIPPCDTSQLSALVEVQNASCKTCPDGSITVNGITGRPPYLYSLDGNTYQPESLFPNLMTGVYTVFVKDANNCVFITSDSVGFEIPPCDTSQLSALIEVQNATCKTCSDGSITVNGVAGRPPYVYSLDGDTYQPENTFPNLISGVYAVFVKDANNCVFSITDSVGFEIPPCDTSQLSALVEVQNASCKTCADGSITVNGIAGRPPYLYSLDGKTYQPENTFPNLMTGVYTVFVKDANSCVFSITDSVLSVNAQVKLELHGTQLSVYPNPVQDILFLRFSQPTTQPLTLSLIDVNGRLLIRKSIPVLTQTDRIEVDHFTEGIYFLQITDGQGLRQTLKVSLIK